MKHTTNYFMKTILLVAIAAFCCFGSFAQPYAFNDAVKLKTYTVNGKFDSKHLDAIKKILTPYLREGEDLRVFTEDNPLFPDIAAGDRMFTYTVNRDDKNVSGFSSIGGLD